MTHFSDIYLVFTDAGDIIRLEPMDLTYPNAQLDWDRNWVKTWVTVKGGVFSGQFAAEFMTTDFEIFKRQLKQLDNDFKGLSASKIFYLDKDNVANDSIPPNLFGQGNNQDKPSNNLLHYKSSTTLAVLAKQLNAIRHL